MTGTDTRASTWALVPLKSPERAKSRLAGVLSPDQRVRVFFALAERVIKSLRATPGIGRVGVVTASADIADFARSLQAEPFVQTTDAGMTAALTAGLAELRAFAPERVLMIPGDLPLISPAALQAFLDAAHEGEGVTVVPDRRRVGTNLLLCSPPCAIAPCFGGHSFERHLAAAAAAGVAARVVNDDDLALDLDEPDDLAHLEARDSASAAQLFDALHIARRTAVAG